LYYRLNVIPINMPALRERREDIPLLAAYFLQSFRMNMNAAAEAIAPETMELLSAYDWPGNVREMRNIIERALVLHGQRQLLPPESLPPEFHASRPTAPPTHPDIAPVLPAAAPPPAPDLEGASLEEAVSAYERRIIERALDQAGGVQTRAAEILGTTRRILKYRMDKLNIRTNGKNGFHLVEASVMPVHAGGES